MNSKYVDFSIKEVHKACVKKKWYRTYDSAVAAGVETERSKKQPMRIYACENHFHLSSHFIVGGKGLSIGR